MNRGKSLRGRTVLGVVALAGTAACVGVGSSDVGSIESALGEECNTLVNDGPVLSVDERNGFRPVLSGGTIPDGRYKLTYVKTSYPSITQWQRVALFGTNPDGTTHFDVVTEGDLHGSGTVLGSDFVLSCGTALPAPTGGPCSLQHEVREHHSGTTLTYLRTCSNRSRECPDCEPTYTQLVYTKSP